jgi:hypothetical protein
VALESAFARAFDDSSDASDLVVVSVGYGDFLSDAANIQDNQVSLVGKVKSDTLEIADSGVLLSQDYVDNNLYFADDYVGEKRIF